MRWRKTAGCKYRRVADWQSVQAGLITCWKIGIDKDEDSGLIDWYIADGGTFFLYTVHTTGLTGAPGGKDGRLSPEPVLGDSGSCRLRSVISGLPLFSHNSHKASLPDASTNWWIDTGEARSLPNGSPNGSQNPGRFAGDVEYHTDRWKRFAGKVEYLTEGQRRSENAGSVLPETWDTSRNAGSALPETRTYTDFSNWRTLIPNQRKIQWNRVDPLLYSSSVEAMKEGSGRKSGSSPPTPNPLCLCHSTVCGAQKGSLKVWCIIISTIGTKNGCKASAKAPRSTILNWASP